MGAESLMMFGLSAAGGLMSTMAAGKQAKVNNQLALSELQSQFQQTGIQNQQLVDEIKTIDTATTQQVADRLKAAEAQKAKNRAFMSASGLSSNQSEQVAADQTDANARRDLTSLGYNAALNKSRIVDQIKVNRMALGTAEAKAALVTRQGTANTIGVGQQSLISAFSNLAKYNTTDFSKLASTAAGAMGIS